jgi:CheY-like chemotaxis protein
MSEPDMGTRTSAKVAHTGLSQPEDVRPLVVIVDDEPGLRRFMGMALQDHYRVVLAADAAEVLALFRGDGQGIAALVTDIRMPGMDGLALVATLRDMGVTIPILFVSGYQVIGEAPGLLLAKPFLPDDLVAAVQTLLGGSGRHLIQ